MEGNKNANKNLLALTAIILLFNILLILNNNNRVYSLLLLFFILISISCVFCVYLIKINYKKEIQAASSAIIKRDNKIKELSYIDQITGLNNKIKLLEDGEQIIKNNPNNSIGIICIDIKDFQGFNNMNGIVIGDSLLKIIATTLLSFKEEYENFSVGKVGSDEYAIILDADKEECRRFFKKFESLLSKNLVDNNIESGIKFTVGVAVYPSDGDNISSLHEKAAATLKIARETNRTDINFYDEEIIKIILERRILEKKLRNCIIDSNFVLFYQPKIDLQTGKLVGREALIRWIDGIDGLIPPNKFIPLAENTGLIKFIDDWVIKEACHQNALWQSKDMGEPVQVSINISAQEFYNNNIVDKISSVLKLTGLDPKYLDIEITETMTMMNIREAIKTMKNLKKLGVSISLDDFGTGYSSLAYLRELPIDVVKIDKSFIDDLEKNKKSVDIARYIIGLSKSIGLKVVAEGIETKSQHNILKFLGCDYGQGYYYGRPVSADLVEYTCLQKDFQRRSIQ